MPNTKYKLQFARGHMRMKTALTLTEMLIVVAIVVILTTMVISITAGIDNRFYPVVNFVELCKKAI